MAGNFTKEIKTMAAYSPLRNGLLSNKPKHLVKL